MEEAYRETCLLFCENPKTTEPSKLFRLFYDFTARYKSAVRDIDKKEKEEETLRKAQRLKTQNDIAFKTRNEKLLESDHSRRHSEYISQSRANTLRPISEYLDRKRADLSSNEFLDRISPQSPVVDDSVFVNERTLVSSGGSGSSTGGSTPNLETLSESPDITPVETSRPKDGLCERTIIDSIKRSIEDKSSTADGHAPSNGGVSNGSAHQVLDINDNIVEDVTLVKQTKRSSPQMNGIAMNGDAHHDTEPIWLPVNGTSICNTHL